MFEILDYDTFEPHTPLDDSSTFMFAKNSPFYSKFINDYFSSFKPNKKIYIINSQSNETPFPTLKNSIISEVNNSEAYILLCQEDEYDNWCHLKHKIKNKLDGINPENIFITTSNAYFNCVQHSYEKDNCPYKLFFFYKYFALFHDKSFCTKHNIKKHFNFLARRDKDHRRYLYYKIKKFNLLEKGNISHHRTLHSHDTTQDDILFKNQLKEKLSKSDYDEYKIYSSETKLLNQNDELNSHTLENPVFWDQFGLTYPKICNTAFLDLVMEASADSGCLFISEKTLKSIAHKKLFLIAGNPYSLKFLQHLGFKTFPHIFDESYDSKLCKVSRLDHISNELFKFCSLSLGDIEKLKNDNKDILDYNYEHLVKNFDCTFNLIPKIQSYLRRHRV